MTVILKKIQKWNERCEAVHNDSGIEAKATKQN